MSLPTITGQSLVNETFMRLGGLSNVFSTQELLSFVNDGVQEVWAIVRSLDADHTVDTSQTTTSTSDNYFQTLSTSTREYTLPPNAREIRFIECTNAGYENTIFEFRKIDDVDFQNYRREATASGTSQQGRVGKYYYTVSGQQLVFAQYPETALVLKVWYIKAIDNAEIDVQLTTLQPPLDRKIVEFATQRAMLVARQETVSDRWMAAWRDSVKTICLSVVPRNSANAIFIQEFSG